MILPISRFSLCNPQPLPSRSRRTSTTRRILWKISALFAVDSLAGGFLTAALLSACPDAVDHSRR